VDHIGIDLGAMHSHVVVLEAGVPEIKRYRGRTSELPGWLSLRPASHVVMEACTQSPTIA